MSDQVKPIPDGYSTVTPYLVLADAAKAIDFYKQAFGAVELFRMPTPDGNIAHAEIKIGNAPLMLSGEYADMGYHGVQHYGGSPVSLMLYVEDCDAVFHQAVAAGATVKQELKDQFYGDRSGAVMDPFGYSWHISTHKEDVAPEEMQRRMAAMGECGGEVAASQAS
ncbi:MAG TPA: VOC family protein [Blastocatellia bacterium]|nr:VOC family protein [Blastocatellia bacterium]